MPILRSISNAGVHETAAARVVTLRGESESQPLIDFLCTLALRHPEPDAVLDFSSVGEALGTHISAMLSDGYAERVQEMGSYVKKMASVRLEQSKGDAEVVPGLAGGMLARNGFVLTPQVESGAHGDIRLMPEEEARAIVSDVEAFSGKTPVHDSSSFLIQQAVASSWSSSFRLRLRRRLSTMRTALLEDMCERTVHSCLALHDSSQEAFTWLYGLREIFLKPSELGVKEFFNVALESGEKERLVDECGPAAFVRAFDCTLSTDASDKVALSVGLSMCARAVELFGIADLVSGLVETLCQELPRLSGMGEE